MDTMMGKYVHLFSPLMENTNCLEVGINFIRVLLPNGQEKSLKVDTILYALGMKSTPFDELKEIVGDLPTDIVGDAIKPGRVDQAISSAYHAAINIGRI